MRHYNVGYAGINLNKDTEYKLRYPAYALGKDAIRMERSSIQQAQNNDVNKTYDEIVSSNNDLRQIVEAENKALQPMEIKFVDRQTRLQRNLKTAENHKNEHENPNFIPSKMETIPSDLRGEPDPIKAPDLNFQHQNSDKNEPEIKVSAENQEKILEKQEEIKKENLEQNMEFEPIKTPPRKIKHEELERQARMRQYKNYLDLQMKLKDQKLEYEKYTKQKALELSEFRKQELEKMEKERNMQKKVFRENLAKEYEQQITEHRHKSLGRFSNEARKESDQNDIFYILDVNRQRFTKVFLIFSNKIEN